MKAFLMHKDRDFDLSQPLPWNETALVEDFGLEPLYDCMAQGDELIHAVAKTAILCSLETPDDILHRQDVLKDCIANEAEVRALYQLATDTLSRERRNDWGWFKPTRPIAILHKGVETLKLFVEMLRKLRRFSDSHAPKFRSHGFSSLFAALNEGLDENYFNTLEHHLKWLRFDSGVMVAAHMGCDGRSTGLVLQAATVKKPCWLRQVFGPAPPRTLYLDPRDESGARVLSELKDRSINSVANALAQATDHILSFFTLLRGELAFYLGCLNLRRRLIKDGYPICFPNLTPLSEGRYSARGLYDPSLALRMARRIVGNDLRASYKNLIIVTGANQGGKSTFLRSAGIAHLLLQAGMFVPARSFFSRPHKGIFTHFRREEDDRMVSGKLDEELSRFDTIASRLKAGSLVLFNESFAATNEREGSEIATQIARALVDSGVTVIFVTHLYTFAHEISQQKLSNALFLRAERGQSGERTFRISEAQPLETSYAKDLYARVFNPIETSALVPSPAKELIPDT